MGKTRFTTIHQDFQPLATSTPYPTRIRHARPLISCILTMKLLYETHVDVLPWTFMSRHVHQACADGRTSDLQSMFDEGADLNESDEMGNTPLWLAYLGGHLDTVFALLEHHVDVNRRTGLVQASDFHRACGWADEVFIDILWNYRANVNLTDRFGKTSLIYAIEYRTPKIEDDLIEFLVDQGANVNHVDMSGLTPLFYAIYRGQLSIVRLLLQHNADYQYENLLGYSPLRYALACLSSSSPVESDRREIVAILLERYETKLDELKNAICTSTATFDLIFYSRTSSQITKTPQFYEDFAWQTFEETRLSNENPSSNVVLAQNILLFNSNVEHWIYFLQRMFIENFHQLITFYLQRLIKEKETNSRRFFLLLYSSFVETNGNYSTMIRSICENQRIYLFKTRRETLKLLVALCHQTPMRLNYLCRREIRRQICSSIDRHLRKISSIPSNLRSFLRLEELNSLNNSTDFVELLERSMSIRSSNVTSSSSTLSNQSETTDFCS